MSNPPRYKPKRKLVRVWWTDTERTPDAWEDVEEVTAWLKKPLLSCPSVGYLLYKGPDHLVLYATDHRNQLLHGLKIPAKCIQEIEYLD